MACGHSTMLPAHRTGRRPSVVDSARSAPSRGLIAAAFEAVAAEVDAVELVSTMVVDTVALVAVMKAACSDESRVTFDAPVLADSSTGGLSTLL